MILVSRDMKRILTTNVSSGTVSIIEKQIARRPMGTPGGDWEQTVVAVGRGAEGFDVSPNGNELWAANAQDGTVSLIDLTAKKVTETLQANVPGANRLKFTPDGKLVFISSLGDVGLAVLDAATHKEVKRIDIGHGAAGIQMQPGRRSRFRSLHGRELRSGDRFEDAADRRGASTQGRSQTAWRGPCSIESSGDNYVPKVLSSDLIPSGVRAFEYRCGPFCPACCLCTRESGGLRIREIAVFALI